jgi:hypothetical protein
LEEYLPLAFAGLLVVVSTIVGGLVVVVADWLVEFNAPDVVVATGAVVVVADVVV